MVQPPVQETPTKPSEDDDLSLTRRRWVPPPLSTVGTPHAGVPKWLSGLLETRGIKDADAVERYLAPSLASLPDPGLMASMHDAVNCLCTAIQTGAAIVVYGDYDVDGVCSTTVLVDFLQRSGAQVTFYIPDRQSEGYGLNAEAVEKICAQAKVLVTTDCGITANEEIALARRLGADVVVVDHHEVPDPLPQANACLDPLRADCDYPEQVLCATGVAFMLVGALRRELRRLGWFGAQRPEPDVRELLDVVAVATVADMVPITGVNRTLLTAGLRAIGRTRRQGLRALLAVSDVDPAKVSATDLGFRLGPRINARGRLGHAREAVELMLTDDADRARALAGALDEANRDRRQIERETFAAAAERVEEQRLHESAGLVLYDAQWHPGVLGLVASRLVSRYTLPAVVIGRGGKGSGRSIEGLDLHACMAAGAEHCQRFGGHRAAAGLTILAENVDKFRATFISAVEQRLGPPPYIATVRPDLELSADELELGMVGDLERIGPFGQGNPEPLFVSCGVPVHSHRTVGDGQHLKVVLGGRRIDGIGFRLGDLDAELPGTVDVVYRISRNTFRGRTSLQLEIEDLRPASSP